MTWRTGKGEGGSSIECHAYQALAAMTRTRAVPFNCKLPEVRSITERRSCIQRSRAMIVVSPSLPLHPLSSHFKMLTSSLRV